MTCAKCFTVFATQIEKSGGNAVAGNVLDNRVRFEAHAEKRRADADVNAEVKESRAEICDLTSECYCNGCDEHLGHSEDMSSVVLLHGAYFVDQYAKLPDAKN